MIVAKPNPLCPIGWAMGVFIGLVVALPGLAVGSPAQPLPVETCQKLSINFPKRDNQSAYRLQCERVADGREQVKLLIEGGKPLVLSGVGGGEALVWPEDKFGPSFDPNSVSVILLESQPKVYWIRYDVIIESKFWSKNRRQWLVSTDDSRRTLFDEWSVAEGKGGGLGVFHSQEEDYVFTSQGKTLQIQKLTQESLDQEHEFESENEEASSSCHRETGQVSITKTLRQLEIATGKLTSVEASWERSFDPDASYEASKKRCAHPGSGHPDIPLTVRDDGVSGWLIVPNPEAPNSLPSPDRSSAVTGIRDPQAPAEIPAIASCWLYNRVAGAHESHPSAYPPAPREQIRSDHFVSKDCCLAETSENGKSIALYESGYESHGGDGPDWLDGKGRLLALFDLGSKTCHSANLARDGRWGKPLVQSIPPEERITLGLGAVHTAQDPKSEEVHTFLDDKITRLPIGTVVLVLGQSAPTSRIDEVEDHWYYISAPKGIFGWAFGGQLAPFDPARPEAGYRKIIEHYQSSNSDSPEEQADFQAFLGRLRAELPKTVAKAQGTQDDLALLVKRVDEHAQACRKSLPGPNGNPVLGESITRHERITIGARVRLRPDPDEGCGFLANLPLGTVVSAVGRTVLTDRINGVVDHWYRVETAEGQTGWIFGGLLLPFDRFHPEQAYSQILNRYQTTRTGSLREALELTGFLAQPRSHLPEALLPDVELAKLRAAGHILSHAFSCGDGDLPPKYALSLADAPWLKARLADVITHVQPVWEGGPPQVNPEAFWVLVDRYLNQPVVGERLAWAVANRVDPVEEKIAHECGFWDEGRDYSDEVMAEEEIESLAKDPLVRYVGLYPNGAHAGEALEKIFNTLAGKVIPDQKGHVLFTTEAMQNPELRDYLCWADFRQGLKTTLKALEPIEDRKAAMARERIKKLLGVSCPSEKAG